MLRTLWAEERTRPYGVAADPTGQHIFVSDERNHVVNHIDHDGRATLICSGLRSPQGLAYADEKLYICEAAGSCVTAVNLTKGIPTVRSVQTFKAWEESRSLPSACFATPSSLFVASAAKHAVFQMDLRSEDIVVVAGTPGIAGNMKYSPCGDLGDATTANLYSPSGLAVSEAGDVYIADSCNGRIRRVRNGFIETVAGADQSRPRGAAGPATNINIGQTRDVVFGNLSEGGPPSLYIACTPGLVWRLDEKENMAIPVAGTWTDGYNWDEGFALETRLNVPCGLAAFGQTLVIADSSNQRVLFLEEGDGTSPKASPDP